MEVTQNEIFSQSKRNKLSPSSLSNSKSLYQDSHISPAVVLTPANIFQSCWQTNSRELQKKEKGKRKEKGELFCYSKGNIHEESNHAIWYRFKHGGKVCCIPSVIHVMYFQHRHASLPSFMAHQLKVWTSGTKRIDTYSQWTLMGH